MKSSSQSVVFLCAILLSNLICCNGATNKITVGLPINDTVQTLEITIIDNFEIPSLTIKCLNYVALNDLNRSILQKIDWSTQHGKWIIFADCFNNGTGHSNYKNFKLEEFLSTGPNDLWNEIDVRFDKFGFIDASAFFDQFKFAQYDIINLYNVGFVSTSFLSNMINNTEIKFGKNNFIDFDNFEQNTISKVQLTGNNIQNLTPDNLSKFTKLSDLQLYYCNFNNNINVFNVPNLFESNPTLHQISIENSITQIVLHDSVFVGLHNLEKISLANNQIDNISENVFRPLVNIKRIVLDNNMIRTLNENTFSENTKLSYISLDGNGLVKFSESENRINFASPEVQFSILDIEFDSLRELASIINNPNINQIDVTRINIPQLTVDDFGVAQNRTNSIKITLQAGSTYFNMPIVSANNVTTGHNTLIQIYVGDGARMCHECDFIKQVLILDDYINIYAIDEINRILFEFTLSVNCRTYNMLEHFYQTFDQNCPSPCKCQYNSLIDKVRVDCSDKNLTNIPYIMYPTQFTHLDSIDLIFTNNLLQTVDFANQTTMIMDKLSTFNFENNTIETLFMDRNPPKFIHYFNLCGNPIFKSETSVEINTFDGVEQIEKNNCLVGSPYLPDINNIAKQKFGDRFKELLKTCI